MESQAKILSLSDALEKLASSFALEAFSVLTGDPLLVVAMVDTDSSPGSPSKQQLAAARANLVQLPCPSIALCEGELSPLAEKLLAGFDVVLDDRDDLEAICETAAKFPIAAMAAVQLLRHSESLSIHEGLIAESLVYSMLQTGPEFQAWRRDHPPSTPHKPNLEPAVLSERCDTQLHLTLNRPEKRNAFSAEMRDALVESLQVAINDPSIREVRITGAGPSFCSGGDLDEFGTLPDPATAHAIRSTRNAGRLITACKEKVRFEVHGACIGAGMELPAFAAHVTATRDCFFQLPEIGLGLVPGAGGTVSIMKRIGRQRTALLALTRKCIDAETALAWGLVDALNEQ